MKKISFLVFIVFICCSGRLVAQNVGIGTTNPTKGKLVVQGTAGAVSAMFGDTTSGVAIENNYPGVAFNSYYNGGRKSITHGFGGLVGMDPNNGDFHIMSSFDSLGVNANMGLFYRMLIKKNGYIGIQGNTDPLTPLAFSNVTGNKILLRGSSDSEHYGLGAQVGLMQLYSPNIGGDIAFGIGSSTKFTENMRVKGNGLVGIGADPVKGKLVVRGTAGAVSAIFGDTTSGVAIENNYPGIAFNSYYNGFRRSITNGYGGLTGMNPYNGDFYIQTAADSLGVNVAMPTFYRMLINKIGNMGIQGNTNPITPLAFSNATGNKILLRGSTDTEHYGLGSQSGLMQLYSPNTGADIAFGIGSSTNFTENMRIKGTGLVGIGADPVKGKLVVRGSVGAVSAIFGDTTSGIAIENNYPGIGFNSYFVGNRKTISHGYGGLTGMNPYTGDFYIQTSADSLGVDAGLPLYNRIVINKTGNIGVQGNNDPVSPLSFASSIGNKISLWGSSPISQYGFGIQGSLLQMYTAGSGSDIAFGYGSSTAFTENMRIKGDGRIGIGTSTPAYPVTLQEEGNGFVQKGNTVEVGTAVSGTGGYIKTFTNHPLYFATGANGIQMTLTYNGRVGVGTTTPTVKFEIAHNQFDLFQLTNTTPLAAGKDVFMNFKTGSVYTGSIGTIGESASEARMSFATGSFLTERLTIKNNGYVGINKTNPSAQLDVNGNSNITGDLDVSGTVSASAISYTMCFSYTTLYSNVSATGKSVILDDNRINGKPGLKLFITRTDNSFDEIPARPYYDNTINKWRLSTNGYYGSGLSQLGYTTCQDNCAQMPIPAAWKECKFDGGEMYNILAIY